MLTKWALGLLVITASIGWAEVKVGLADLQKALQTVEPGKNAKSQLEKEVNSKRTSIEKRFGDLQKEAEAFDKKAAILSDSAKATKQAELQKKYAEIQKTAAESQADLQKRERELTTPILDDLKNVIEGLGKEGNYDLIVEKNASGILYAKTSSDVTEQVIDRFNSKFKGKKKK